MQTTLTNHYLNGSSYPVRGPSELAKAAVAQLEALGSRVLVRCNVKEILTEGDVVTGVSIEDGPTVRAPIVVSSAGVVNTFTSMLPQAICARHGYDAMLARLKNSTASTHLSLFVTLRGTQDELNLPASNLWVYPDEHHDRNIARFGDADPCGKDGLPMLFISFPSAKDPDYHARSPGLSACEVLSLAPYDLFQPFDAERVKARGRQYESMKAKIAERLLERLHGHFPALKGRVVGWELGTPVTTKHYLRSPGGASYGLAHDPARFKEPGVNPVTKIAGLYLTGQDTLCVGVLPAVLSGVITAMAITGVDYMSEITGEIKRRRAVAAASAGGKKKAV
jgi:all-trans-retinol 13,14-reductase